MDIGKLVDKLLWIILALGVLFEGSVLAALVVVIVFIPDASPDKTAIVGSLANALTHGLAGLVGAIVATFTTLAATRRNVSVAEAEGKPPPETP